MEGHGKHHGILWILGEREKRILWQAEIRVTIFLAIYMVLILTDQLI